MKLLYVTKTSPLSEGGGGEKRAREVTKRLSQRDHEVTILCGKTERDLPKQTRHQGCSVRHVTCIPEFLFRFSPLSFYATRYLFAIFSIPVLVWSLLTDRPAVILENMTPYPTLTVVFAKLWDIPIVAVQHEFYDRSCYETYDPVTATIQLTVQNFLRVFQYAMMIVPSTHVREDLAAYGVDISRIEVIPNGINWERYQLPDVDSRDRALITIGRLSKRKGQADVLRAFAEVHSKHPDVTLEVIGKGPAREKLEQLVVELGITDTVTFHGFVSDEQKIRELNQAELFVFGSKQEGFGLVLLEAMAAGLPVVARRLPAYEDFFVNGRNGRLIDPPVVPNIAASLNELLENGSACRDISRRNREDAAAYSWDRTAAETAAVLQAVKNGGESLNDCNNMTQ